MENPSLNLRLSKKFSELEYHDHKQTGLLILLVRKNLLQCFLLNLIFLGHS